MASPIFLFVVSHDWIVGRTPQGWYHSVVIFLAAATPDYPYPITSSTTHDTHVQYVFQEFLRAGPYQ